jgi:pimeloyl-ACP methyl ester carboxylesterase
MIEPRQHGYFKIHNANIYYRIYGNGERTLFFLHGNGEDWTCFKKQIEYFAGEYTVVTMDSRGHGHSGISERPLTIRQIAQDAAVLIGKLKLEHVTLVGFSDGANIALEMVLNTAFPYERVVLGGGNLNPKGVKMRYQLPIIIIHAFYEQLSKLLPKFRLKADIMGLMTHEPNIQPERLSRITIPVLVMAGENDMIKTEHTKLMASSLPNSTLAIIPEADHFIFGGRFGSKANHVMRMFFDANEE